MTADELFSSRLSIRQLREGDLDFAMELKNLAGWNQVKRDWRNYLSFAPDGCFLAEYDGEPAGTATTIVYGKKFGWVGMVLVHPSKRRHGIGTELLRHAIDYLRAKRVNCIKLDATAMGKKVYVPLGFQDEYEVTRYQGIAPNFARDHFQGQKSIADADGVSTTRSVKDSFSLRTINEEDFTAIAAFDGVHFGADREAVLRELRNAHGGLTLSVYERRDVLGYIMAHEGYEAVQVGPWVAVNRETAEVLWVALLKRLTGRKIFLDVPRPNFSGIQLMEKYGFQVQRGFWRMFFGENLHPGRPETIFGTSGAEKG